MEGASNHLKARKSRSSRVKFARRHATFYRKFVVTPKDIRNSWYSDEEVCSSRQSAAVLIQLYKGGEKSICMRGLEAHVDPKFRVYKRHETDLFRQLVLTSQSSAQAATISHQLSAQNVHRSLQNAHLDSCEAALVYQEEQPAIKKFSRTTSTGVLVRYSLFSRRKRETMV